MGRRRAGARRPLTSTSALTAGRWLAAPSARASGSSAGARLGPPATSHTHTHGTPGLREQGRRGRDSSARPNGGPSASERPRMASRRGLPRRCGSRGTRGPANRSAPRTVTSRVTHCFFNGGPFAPALAVGKKAFFFNEKRARTRRARRPSSRSPAVSADARRSPGEVPASGAPYMAREARSARRRATGALLGRRAATSGEGESAKDVRWPPPSPCRLAGTDAWADSGPAADSDHPECCRPGSGGAQSRHWERQRAFRSSEGRASRNF
ncbi:hypothetical protein HPB47_002824 [Ixodes persulcatus]|uniref:Uncharacterized protein n=1 Tax=Ixodes persulcatus TaxID=34615 RepID=A0AC60PL55_IXOPE|nr:hypothetical protein HPB47_002824 [Ixodes persulcatus]